MGRCRVFVSLALRNLKVIKIKLLYKAREATSAQAGFPVGPLSRLELDFEPLVFFLAEGKLEYLEKTP